MSSEPKPQPSPGPRPTPRRTGGSGPSRPDPARYRTGGETGAAELARALGYDPDDLAAWPGNAPAAAASAAVTEASADEDAVTLTDAKAMRAIAHPLRMAILELFAVRETLTATQASETLGESPANCAFHLRTLAKYGFVREAGGGRGRERPWALASRTMTLTTNQPDPQAALAAGELSRLWLERWIDRTRRVYGSRNDLPGWDEASGWSNSHVFLTADETRALRAEVRRLLKHYEDRLANPALRPEGALPVEVTLFASPAPELAEPADGPGNPGGGRPGTADVDDQ
jgi:predicted transcriptional regulator